LVVGSCQLAVASWQLPVASLAVAQLPVDKTAGDNCCIGKQKLFSPFTFFLLPFAFRLSPFAFSFGLFAFCFQLTPAMNYKL